MAQDIIEKVPTADQSVNKPESGTYGEKADRARLEKALPPMQPGGQSSGGGPAPMGRPSPNVPPLPGGRPKASPSGVPGAVMAPTDRPGVPIQTPLAGDPQSPIATAESVAQARIALLQQLSTSNEVSSETREWAKMVLEILSA